MKYNVGDKFIVRIKQQIEGYYDDNYLIENLEPFWFNNEWLDKLDQLTDDYINEHYGMSQDTAYQNLEDREDKSAVIKECQPPTDDWEHYADRLYDLAYEHGKKDALEPCKDAISRDFALNEAFDVIVDGEKFQVVQVETLLGLPSVRPARPRGKWAHREDMDFRDKMGVVHNHFMCASCGFIKDFVDGHTAQYQYCPQCGNYNGADM